MKYRVRHCTRRNLKITIEFKPSNKTTAHGGQMVGMGRHRSQSGGRRAVCVSILLDMGTVIANAVTRISNELHPIVAITERWTLEQRWTLLLTRLLRCRLGGKWLDGLPEGAGILLSGWKIQKESHPSRKHHVSRSKAICEHAIISC